MPTDVIICDDSLLARKQINRALPKDWVGKVTMTSGGAEALEAVRGHLAGVLFLDLTMPEIDGYSVLKSIKEEGLKIVVIVISADIQPEAIERVKAYGALGFIKKPVEPQILKDFLHEYGLL